MKKKSLKWLNIGLIVIISITILGFFGIYYSYKQSKEYALDFGQSQLMKINKAATLLIQSSIDDQKEILQQVGLVYNSKGQQEIIQEQLKNLLTKDKKFQSLFLIPLKDTSASLEVSSSIATIDSLDLVQKDTLLNKELTTTSYENGTVYFYKNKAFLNLYQPIYDENGQLTAVLVAPINLDAIYRTIEDATLNNEYNGYTMVKNKEMKVIMHPSAEQIGLNIITGRKQLYPDLNYNDLERLEQQQLTHQSGTLTYYSYWWTSKKLNRVLKIAAYQWITIGNQKWVVASSTEFNRHNAVLKQEFIIGIGVLSIFTIVVFLLYLNMKNIIRREKFSLENQKLLSQKSHQESKYELEKNLLQESKLEIIGLLTTSIVHDLNNFLTPLLGNIELLLEDYKDNPELYEELMEIYIAAQKGHDLSKRVLNFSKVSLTERDAFYLSAIVQDSVNTMTILMPRTMKLTMIRNFDAEILADADEIQMIIYNLIINSMQASKQGGTIQVTIDLANPKKIKTYMNYSHQHINKEHIQFTISDNGPGISKDIQAKIFTPFFTTKSTEDGTGLGLFIVQSIIKKNDWLLKLESSPEGTSFSIAIPIETNHTMH